MRIGLIRRPEVGRGLGVQTTAMMERLAPTKTLTVDDEMSMTEKQWLADSDVHRNAGARGPTRQDVAWLLDGIDVLLTVETFYESNLPIAAKAAGVRTVCHGNPEFYRGWLAHPTRWWWPTHWMVGSGRIPYGPVVPVPMDPGFTPSPRVDGPLRVVHVAGKRAVGDRNGTDLFLEALPLFDSTVQVTITAQERAVVLPKGVRCDVEVLLDPRDRWTAYRNQDVLVLPRRYGGLCLPALEAMSVGVAVAMPAIPPNDMWPTVRWSTAGSDGVMTSVGNIRAMRSKPEDIASTVNELAGNSAALTKAKERAAAFGRVNTWAARMDEWMSNLEAVCASKP